MRLHHAPAPLLQLLATLLFTSAPAPTSASPHPPASSQAGFTFDHLFARWDCSGETCGWAGDLCCSVGSACYTDNSNRAQCSSTAGGGGGYSLYTSTYTKTDLKTYTTTGSYYGGGAVAATPTGNPNCNHALGEVSCGTICCAGDQFCARDDQCADAAGGDSSADGEYMTPTAAGPPILGTSSALTTETETASPSETVPFAPPVATGANVTMTESSAENGGGGLSGGAIAGIVIGVLAGLALLGLLCFYCCVKGIFDGIMACFGGGKRRRRRTEIDEYERHSHHRHGSRSGAGGAGRTWYGAQKGPKRASSRRDDGHSKSKGLLGVGAGLAGLWAILGLKRRRDDRKNDEKYSDYSYSSDYYTSASSASSDDRRTYDTRRSYGRSQSRR